MAEGRRVVERWLLPASAGAAAVALGVGAGELTAALIDSAGSPIAAVGSALIDLSPPWAKEAAISLFGTADKLVLIVLVALGALVGGGLAGVVEFRRPPWGRVIIGGGGLLAIAAVATRAGIGQLSIVPSIVLTAVAIVTLAMLVRMLRRPAQATTASEVAGPTDPATTSGTLDRRRFLGFTIGAAALGALGAAGGFLLQTGARAASAVREALTLPKPAVAAAPLPAGVELAVEGITPIVTPTSRFYRIDTALVVPQIDPASWKLRVTGMVDHEFDLGWDELLSLPLEESYTTLVCVSNPVGGTLIGNAKWLGYPVRHVLARAGVRPDADMVLSTSHDGFTASTPLEALTDDRNAILAIAMNDEPLPAQHGFPVRMVVPGLYGFVSATKWVTELKVTRFDQDRAYWTDNGYSAEAPVKISCRIDLPQQGTVAVGPVVVAGVAWNQHVGIERVELQVDHGPWSAAELSHPISDDTWVQWRWTWDAEPGMHTLRARAVGSDGEVQTQTRHSAAPDGATGWHELYYEAK